MLLLGKVREPIDKASCFSISVGSAFAFLEFNRLQERSRLLVVGLEVGGEKDSPWSPGRNVLLCVLN